MAAQPQDTQTGQLPALTPNERQWVNIGLENIKKGIIRNRALVAQDSAMYKAMGADIDALSKLQERFK